MSDMSESPAESAPSHVVWDVARYVIVAVVAGFLIWWYFLYTPVNYISREHTGKAMGTDYKVQVARFPENASWETITEAIQHRLDTLEEMMSSHRHGSEVSRFNASTDTEEWFPVSPETARVVQAAQTIANMTEGAFDITIAPLVPHWGFGIAGGQRQNRSFEDLRTSALQLKEQTGYEKLSVRLDPPALKKAIPELAIDLSGIAKGFAVDSIAELLEEHQMNDYLIEIGGEVRGKGKRGKDRDREWIVGIEKPTRDFTGFQQVFPLENQSLATSGHYLQTIQIDGQRVSHLLDPRTGLPVPIRGEGAELTSVAVLAPDCTQADAFATAMFILGEQKGGELANRLGIAVLFLLDDGNAVMEVPTTQWEKTVNKIREVI